MPPQAPRLAALPAVRPRTAPPCASSWAEAPRSVLAPARSSSHAPSLAVAIDAAIRSPLARPATSSPHLTARIVDASPLPAVSSALRACTGDRLPHGNSRTQQVWEKATTRGADQQMDSFRGSAASGADLTFATHPAAGSRSECQIQSSTRSLYLLVALLISDICGSAQGTRRLRRTLRLRPGARGHRRGLGPGGRALPGRRAPPVPAEPASCRRPCAPYTSPRMLSTFTSSPLTSRTPSAPRSWLELVPRLPSSTSRAFLPAVMMRRISSCRSAWRCPRTSSGAG